MKKLINKLIKLGKKVSTMESCTGGYVSSTITDIDGAGEVFEFSAITYTNEYKIKMGVDKKVIDKYSVYSVEVANEMAKSISRFTNTDYGIGITGKIDKYNKNTVYISVFDRLNSKFYNMILNSKEKTRFKNKKYIVKEIEKLLLNILDNI